MRFDSLSQPVSEEEPAGPDLDEAMDSDYLNYTLVAPDRLPTSFLVQSPGGDSRIPFDRSSIDLNAETETIAGFLKRTRDLRLVTLDARFHAAAGKIIGFVEATQGLAAMLPALWDDVHPKPADGDMIVRQNTIESLDDLGQIVLHLQNAPIAGGGRTRPVSLRNYLVATGKAQAREDEPMVALAEISATMINEANAADITTLHGAIEESRAALDVVRSIFMERAGAEFTPSFPNLTDLYKQMRDMIGAFRTDLAPPPEAGEEGTEGYADGAAGAVTISGAVKTHADATAALTAAESYFMRLEPSSPALILVHQSRMLIGRPLTFALEALMPEPSMRAALRFDTGFKFDIDLARMKAVTDDALAYGVPEDPDAQSSDGGWGSESTAATDDTASTTGEDWSSWASAETPAEESTDGSSYEASPDETPAEDAPAEDASSDGSAYGEVAEETPPEPEPEPYVEPEPEPAPPPPPPVPSGPTSFRAATRAQAADLIQATESFFRAAEPSSAIPLLLSKARTYINKDFASILSELIPRDPTVDQQ